MKRVALNAIRAIAPLKPPGYVEEYFRLGRQEGPMIVLSDEDYASIAARFPQQSPKPPDPSALDLTMRFHTAVSTWAGAGFPVVSQEQYEERKSICGTCAFWRSDARLGLGKCLQCGCTRLKHWLATESCPMDKW